MASTPPVIHVLDKVDYSKHRLVTLPSEPLPPLAPSSLRLRSKIIGLTTNNFSYARLGHLLGWWDIYPQPTNTPAPYNKWEDYGRIAGWGYAEILESTVPEIPAGQSVYGYIAVGTLPFDVTIEATGLKNQIFVTSSHRQHLWKIYNRYRVEPPLPKLVEEKGLDSLGWDTYSGLWGTAYNLNRYAFAWTYANLIHPGGDGEWSTEDANLNDAAVVILNASGKTGMAFAYVLRHARPKEHQPKTIIGVCSAKSKPTAEKSSFYDQVVLYSDEKGGAEAISQAKPRRIVLLDFGARTGVASAWRFISVLGIPSTTIIVGGEVKPEHPEEVTRRRMKSPGATICNASELLGKGIGTEGDGYFENYHRHFDDFKKEGGYPGTKLKWGADMGDWEKEWEALCKDDVAPETGLVFKL
ncbi:hypothetical protein P154DRAFT_522624 [Amniculicola lignicola CBS 123094]|uniref:Uncharacterized protein n=1 Tax=Amniculicola lignicola CBS 123094 TaxID=1392246 RepID=A0A6A5WG96_9PLEO|nr:hypothetical protein P154DRAFT_522624 [Amniculicola lignicola CBS 123094]